MAQPQFELKSENKKHTLTLRPFYRLDPDDEKRSHADVRKASYRLSLEHFELGAGAGIFAWGVLESYRPTDVLNQTDFVESITSTAKLGQPYAEVGWIAESAALRLYYLPYFRARTFQGIRGRLRFPIAIDTDHPIFESRYREWQPSGAARFSFNTGEFDFGVGLFTGLSREPRFVAELTTGSVVPRYDVMHQASIDAQWTLSSFVFKAEGYVRASNTLRVFGGGGAGVSHPLFKWGDAEMTVALEYLFDTRREDAPITFFEHDAFLGVRLAFNDFAGTEITGGTITDVIDGTSFVRLYLTRRFGEHWRIALGANVFRGPKGKLESALLRDDYGHLQLAYYF
ncbi:MAG: hypothetical protein NVSMB1_06560 [Polyangiales bacterium]